MTTITGTTRYGTARAAAWGRLHQRLASRVGWESHDGELPVIEGTLIRLAVDHLPGDRSPEPLWLWPSRAETSADAVNRTWHAFLRRFDIEHTFRFLKQVLGRTRPKLRAPAAADRWTWLILACYAQLRLARQDRRTAARPPGMMWARPSAWRPAAASCAGPWTTGSAAETLARAASSSAWPTESGRARSAVQDQA